MKLAKVASVILAVFVVLLVVVSAGCTTSSDSLSGEVTVLAATSLTKAMDDIIAEFEDLYKNVDVKASYGGSNSLVTQMTSGAADADVFFSADVANMKKVVDAGLTNDYSVLLNNSLIIVVGKGNPKNITGIADLVNDGIEIASGVDGVPFASYGLGVAEKYENAGNPGFKDEFVSHITYKGQNVNEARTAVATGECDAAIIYKTDYTAAADKLDIVEIPASYNTVTELPYTILNAAADDKAVAEFVKYMTSENGKNIFQKYGFVIAA